MGPATRLMLIPVAIVITLAAGCASYDGSGLRPGIDTQAQVRATMGEPAAKYQDPDGGSIWAYPHGPTGMETFIARFSRSGALEGIESVLNAEHFLRITPGMDRDAVKRTIGPPGREEAFRSRNELVWDYRFQDAWGYPSYFSVMFDGNGKVKETLAWREHIDNSN
ncbi:MAG: hypothetical protein ACXWAC_11970 [Usitatibacter sp.]